MISQLSSRLSPRLWWLFRLLSGVLALGILLVWQGESILAPLRIVPWWTLPVSIMFYWMLQALCAKKWQLLLNAAMNKSTFEPKSTFAKEELSFLTCASFYLSGMFWNLWMPTSIGGDAVRSYLAGKYCNNFVIAASSVFIDRLSGLVSLLLIGALAMGVQGITVANQTNSAALKQGESILWIATGLLILLLIAGIASYFLTSCLATSKRTIVARLAAKWQSLHTSLALFWHPQNRPILFMALVIAFFYQAGLVILNIGLAWSVHLQLPLLTFWWLVPALSLAALLPVGIGGLGVREVAAVALIGPIILAAGGQNSTIIAWSLLWQATFWTAGLPGGWTATAKQSLDTG